MIRRVVTVAIWLAAWSAGVAGLYWAFLNTPESTTASLGLSAFLALTLLLATAVAVNTSVLLAVGEPLQPSLRGALRRVHWFVAAALPVALIAWLLLRADAWVATRSGEISAWFIASLGWADASPFFLAQRYVSLWLRWVAVPIAGLAVLTACLRHGAAVAVSRRWMRAAWHWRTLAIATTAFVLLIALPWRAAAWRPTGLPPTWVEPTLAGLRLLLVTIAIAVGAAIILVTAARAADDSDATVQN